MFFRSEFLTRHLFEPLFWRLKSMPVLKQAEKFRSLQYTSVDDFQIRQNVLLEKILTNAILNIPYYENFNTSNILLSIKESPKQALLDFPVLSKDDLRYYFSNMRCDPKNRFFVNSSGGSTGKPTRFYQDRNYQISALASIQMFYEWSGKRSGFRHAVLWGAERDLVKGRMGIKKHFSDYIGNRLTLNAFRLSPERMLEYVVAINKFKPMCVEGYAQALYEFSQFIVSRQLKVHSPSVIISSAGTLYKEMRSTIEGAFSSEVFDRYGSREVSAIAAECHEHSGLHVFGETNFVEVVDEDFDEVSEGQEGEVLVTNLTNFTMPLIRYRIGDRAVKGKMICSCGRPYPLLEKIVGRSDSSFVTKAGGVVSPEFFIHLIGVMHNDGCIGKFQVIQKDFDSIVLKLVPSEGRELINWNAKNKIIEQIQTAMGGVCKVEFRIEEQIEPSPTGKHLHTISLVKKNKF
jgi:phenylacetate-CoA ligase